MNKSLAVGCLGVIALVLIVLFAAVGTYNGLIGKKQAVDQAWAQVQNVYQRRADLIPNLVATVQGAANFEKSTLTAVTEARASVGRAQVQLPAGGTPTQAQLNTFAQAQNQLGSAISRLLVVSEQYPTLKATENFRDLQAQLEGTENRISVERERFNQAAQTYNTALLTFPTVLYARMLGFQERPYFTATPGADMAPKVDFK